MANFSFPDWMCNIKHVHLYKCHLIAKPFPGMDWPWVLLEFSKLHPFGQRHGHIDNCFGEVGKLWISFEVKNSSLFLHELPLFELINRVCGFIGFNKMWPKCSSDISAPNCVRLSQKSKYFCVDFPASYKNWKMFCCLTSKGIFLATNSNNENFNTLQLLAHHLLSDMIQSVWMSVVT